MHLIHFCVLKKSYINCVLKRIQYTLQANPIKNVNQMRTKRFTLYTQQIRGLWWGTTFRICILYWFICGNSKVLVTRHRIIRLGTHDDYDLPEMSIDSFTLYTQQIRGLWWGTTFRICILYWFICGHSKVFVTRHRIIRLDLDTYCEGFSSRSPVWFR